MKTKRIFLYSLLFIALIAVLSFNFFKEKRVVSKKTETHLHLPNTEHTTLEIDKIGQIPTPQGYTRNDIPVNSFGDYLRNISLKSKNSPVKLYNGENKNYQELHYRVLDISVGKRDLQQCADAVMRLRAEYLLKTNQKNKISFNYTSGDAAIYEKWATGFRPSIKGNKVTWSLQAKADTSYSNFLKYMENVFMYAGSASLSKELQQKDIQNLEIGDVFIQGGFPGHAVLVVDVALHPTTNKKVFLIAQSYMPAQDIHILKNFNNEEISPWYEVLNTSSQEIITPQWIFKQNDLMSFE